MIFPSLFGYIFVICSSLINTLYYLYFYLYGVDSVQKLIIKLLSQTLTILKTL